ncbi:MAG TPA: rhomboid family intramembrane serine protease [Puia sp.]|nr:rhomboid family intramembrane serine protease [Puia sp.]
MEDNYRKKMTLGQDGNALVQLIVINAVFFAILQFINVVYTLGPKTDDFYTRILGWFALPAGLDKLSTRPWTLLTYMFADKEILHFISNMLWLWGFGYILQDMTGNRKLIPVYIYGGFAGAAFYLLTFSLLPSLRPQLHTHSLIGANPAVIAVALATTTVAPDYRIFPMINGGIPLWILTIIFLLVDFSGISRGDTGVYMANLAGAGGGFFFIYLLRRGYDGSIWMNQFFDWCNDLYNPNKKKKARSPKDEFYYKVSGTQPFKKIPNITQQRIDEILDKINQQGYRFLTDEEKEILKRAADEEDL